MTIKKILWNMKSDASYSIAKVGHSLMEGVTRNNPTVTRIDWAKKEDGSIFITLADKTQIQVMHPDEVYYEPFK